MFSLLLQMFVFVIKFLFKYEKQNPRGLDIITDNYELFITVDRLINLFKMAKGRLPQAVAKVVPQVKNPIKLRNFIVSGTQSQRLAGICIPEISELFLCFKKHNFNEEYCAKEVLSFKNCYNSHLRAFKTSKQSSAYKISSNEVNDLMKKYDCSK